MKTHEFLDLLKSNAQKQLVFEYAENTYVPRSYHITEVKNVHTESVDCGGRPDSYDETIVQLWVDDNEKKDKYMHARKALKIFDIVNGKTPMKMETPIYFEWGHGDLRTSVYKVEGIKNMVDKLVVKLFVAPTVCKPKFELELVGADCSGTGCC